MKTPLLLAAALLIALGLSTTMGNAQTNPEKQVLKSLDNYFLAWGEPDDDKRRALLTGSWAENGTYTDPGAHAEGLEALVEHIGGFLSNPQLKGFSIQQTSGIGVHHRSFRFTWEMRGPTGNVLTPGIDYGEFDDEGRITKIVGFFGPFPKLKD